jgi:hypothetical protein
MDGVGASPGFLAQLGFIDLLIVLILWTLLVPPWQLFLNNLFYGTLGLNNTSTWQTGVVAASMTVGFFVFILTFRNILALAAGFDVPQSVPILIE